MHKIITIHKTNVNTYFKKYALDYDSVYLYIQLYDIQIYVPM